MNGKIERLEEENIFLNWLNSSNMEPKWIQVLCSVCFSNEDWVSSKVNWWCLPLHIAFLLEATKSIDIVESSIFVPRPVENTR